MRQAQPKPVFLVLASFFTVSALVPAVAAAASDSQTVLTHVEGGRPAWRALGHASKIVQEYQPVEFKARKPSMRRGRRTYRNARFTLDLSLRRRGRRWVASVRLKDRKTGDVLRRVIRVKRRGGLKRIARSIARLLRNKLPTLRQELPPAPNDTAQVAVQPAKKQASRAAVTLEHNRKLVGTWKPERLADEDEDGVPTSPADPAATGTVATRGPDATATVAAPRKREGLIAMLRPHWEEVVFGLLGLAVLLLGFLHSAWINKRRQARGVALLAKAEEEKLDTPPSLHPVIDESLCLGCGTCTMVCPDRSVLGLVDNVARLVTPANCVGHGVCAQSCPAGAMKLVFGTEQKPMDLPRYESDYQSNVPGLYIAGELGGMGLIANAFEQAVEATNNIAAELGSAKGGDIPDLLIVGAGPAGLAASLRAKEIGLSYRTVDQEKWGGAIRAYPRAKLVMTRPMRVPLYGPVKLRETTKEELIDLFAEIIEKTGVQIESETRVENVKKVGDRFLVQTSRGEIWAKRVLLAMGQRGTPRKLGVPGEESAHVAYSMIEPEPWTGKRVVVVGGGDVACEVALSLSEQPGTQVAMLYRGKTLSRPKPKNRRRVEAAVREGRIRLVLGVDVHRVSREAIDFAVDGGQMRLAADQIFACIGGVPPTKFLSAAGIQTQTLAGQAPGEADEVATVSRAA